jgi:hypothetical protein
MNELMTFNTAFVCVCVCVRACVCVRERERQDNIKMNHNEIGRETVAWIYLT